MSSSERATASYASTTSLKRTFGCLSARGNDGLMLDEVMLKSLIVGGLAKSDCKEVALGGLVGEEVLEVELVSSSTEDNEASHGDLIGEDVVELEDDETTDAVSKVSTRAKAGSESVDEDDRRILRIIFLRFFFVFLGCFLWEDDFSEKKALKRLVEASFLDLGDDDDRRKLKIRSSVCMEEELFEVILESDCVSLQINDWIERVSRTLGLLL